MATYRERREARAAKRREWAGTRAAASDRAHEAARQIHDMIPFGQPILVGHHSEKRHRKDIARFGANMDASVEHARMADRHASAADEIERQLAVSIYDDDPDAIERLTEKIAALEAQREECKAANAAYRKEHREALKAMTVYERSCAVPFPSYSISNLGGRITEARKRLERLKRAKETGPVYREMFARFGGNCDRCDGRVEKGDRMFWCKTADERMLCADCGKG